MINLILAALLPGVQIDGAWLDAEAARGKGVVISESVEDGRPTANLVYRYPDRRDQIHDDNLAEIESQTVSKPSVSAMP